MDTEENEPGESTTDDVMIEMLANGNTHLATGEAMGRSSKFVQRRLRDPEFARRVAERQSERLHQVVGLLGNHVVEAIETMKDELQAERSSDRLRAASLIVGSLVKVREQVELDLVVTQLRAEIDELRKKLETN